MNEQLNQLIELAGPEHVTGLRVEMNKHTVSISVTEQGNWYLYDVEEVANGQYERGGNSVCCGTFDKVVTAINNIKEEV